LESRTIKYYSTNGGSPGISFQEALLKGLAPDGGLYMPDFIPRLTLSELEGLPGKDYPGLAFTILNKLLENDINTDDLYKLCTDAYNFEVPIEKVSNRKYILRLDRGPTASFKDFAARMMSRLMQYYLSANNKQITILTATSGDTGSAVASAFFGLKNINVIILYPEDEVSIMQRKQMATLQNNIKVIAVKGKFDDCQRLVKTAFLDPALSGINLSSANSINIGRLLPQSVYYFYAWSKLSGGVDDKAVFSVPSGNFGNLMGGLIAKKMGLPVKQFVISTNDNNEVPEFLRTGSYESIVPSKNCISSAMNVGHPSNLARIIALYGGIMDENGIISKQPDIERMREDLFSISASDEITRTAIADIFRKYNIILEPHGAIAWYGAKEYCRTFKKVLPVAQLCISIETAHPAKFPEEIREIIKVTPQLPVSLTGLDEKPESFHLMENNYNLLKEFILEQSNLRTL
jgi:threonine synthase